MLYNVTVFERRRRLHRLHIGSYFPITITIHTGIPIPQFAVDINIFKPRSKGEAYLLN